MQTRGATDSGRDFSQIENQDLQARQVVERPGNTMNTILLDVISESIQICDLSFCVNSLNHMYFRAVWGLSTDSLPAWKQLVDKNNGDAGRKMLLRHGEL